MKWAVFFVNWYKFRNVKSYFHNYKLGIMEKGWGFRDHGTLKLGVSHKWFDELNRLIESDGYPLKLPKFAILGWHCLA